MDKIAQATQFFNDALKGIKEKKSFHKTIRKSCAAPGLAKCSEVQLLEKNYYKSSYISHIICTLSINRYGSF